MLSNLNEINGILLDEDILSPYAYRSYKSIIRKNQNIKGHILIISEVYNKIISSPPTIEISDENTIICSLSDCFENIYSCMDYLSQVLRQVYKSIYKGLELPDGFNSILKEVIKDDKRPQERKKDIYKDKILKNYILKSKSWYNIVHQIRTEETHYGMGKLKIEYGKLIYENQNRNGETDKIKFHIFSVKDIYIQFCSYINELDKIILNLNE